jgi:hypothetical protein
VAWVCGRLAAYRPRLRCQALNIHAAREIFVA